MPPDNLSRKSVTAGMDIDAVVRGLAASPAVDGLAVYGPPTAAGEPGADHDILALVSRRPCHLAQIFTHTAGCTADVLWIDVATYDQVIEGRRKLSPLSVEGVFMRKMVDARVIVDRSGRLERGRTMADQAADWLRVSAFSGWYEQWFSLNFGLARMKRAIQSSEPVHLTAFDLMFAWQVGAACRAYFDFREIPWPGEKSAVRYLGERDPRYLESLRECIIEPARGRKLTLYQNLLTVTLAPFGECWDDDATAAAFSAPMHEQAGVADALNFWESCFGARS